MSNDADKPSAFPADQPDQSDWSIGKRSSASDAVLLSAVRASAFSLVWEPLVLLLLRPAKTVIVPRLTHLPFLSNDSDSIYPTALAWGLVYVAWMLPITMYRQVVIARRAGIDVSVGRGILRGLQALVFRATVISLLAVWTAGILSEAGLLLTLAIVSAPATGVLLLRYRAPTSSPAPTTVETLPDLQQFAAEAGFPEVAVRRTDDPLAPPCSLNMEDRRSVVRLSKELLDEAPSGVLQAAVAHELAHHQAGDLRKAGAMGMLAFLVALFPAVTVLQWLAAPRLTMERLLSALPWSLFVAWVVLTAAFLAIRAWERNSERRANRRALELIDEPADLAKAVAMVSAAPPENAGPIDRALWRVLSSHPHPDTVARRRSEHSHKSG